MDDKEILQIAQEHNRGDLGIGIKVNQRRADFSNRDSLRTNVFAGEVINRSLPEANYQFCWVPFNDDEFFSDCKDEGYRVVTKSEWLCNRDAWAWNTPDKDRYTWSVANMLVYRSMFLVYRDEDLWKQQQDNRAKFSESRIVQRYEQEAENAQRISFDAGVEGLEVEATNSGQDFKAKGTKRRATAI